jgi:hypothetical protein
MKLTDFSFTPLDPEKTLEIVKQHPDILTPLATAQQAKLRGNTCTQCGASLEVRLAPVPFSPQRILPRYIGSCPRCKVDGAILDT